LARAGIRPRIAPATTADENRHQDDDRHTAAAECDGTTAAHSPQDLPRQPQQGAPPSAATAAGCISDASASTVYTSQAAPSGSVTQTLSCTA
jgi:hypothetical protein